MGTIELRKKWKKSITTVDDRFLRMIDALYNSYLKNPKLDFFDELPKEIQETLLISRKEAKNGFVTPHTEIMSLFREKYSTTD